MTTTIDLHFRYRITDEARFDEYLALVPPITESQEPYVLEYELARDHDIVLQHERYEDEAAIARHLDVTAEGQRARAESTELLDIRFVGALSDDFKQRNDTPLATWWTRYRSVER
ncbi:antibiotic biosynthesis monooxygenase [Allobranchiibius huperziae]|uniref:Quinol monooxygenase YgiN n=1 Tax=Allobranchiibius huperziae TaxID=1874116 RepID=A0A853D891_9MICO|nr:hypothetical protein [Allobranchiibius huperziae]NYJ73178.1 quinol monooxygenase YgiN [Allobranchiibius huperziae]